MPGIPLPNAKIMDDFWSVRLRVNAGQAIFHQWQMLEESGCIDNFRIAAGEKTGVHAGWFFADSDATKWLDAASRIERNQHDDYLSLLMDDFIHLLGRAQSPDGYLFTYNQIHFPGQRWVNLQIEHELYCHGHLIEAGVSHFEATGREEMLRIACKAADLLVHDFLGATPERTPGHEEVELALLRLWQVTGQNSYKDLAEHFLEQRGRSRFFGFSLVKQFISNAKREKKVAQACQAYFLAHPENKRAALPAMNQAVKSPLSTVRFFASALSGKYFQQHRPIREQKVPVGHSVRFGYLETAQAMLLHAQPDAELLATMQTAWEHMVTRRMDVTGGLGALPDLEGFGRDDELKPESAYNETCAALACLFWNWQMVTLTTEAKYSDLFEWQLYNAVSVGMGWQGDSYFYNNPTLCRGGITRQPWYSIPCCPSNLSRTYADLGKYLFSAAEKAIWVHQYIGCTATLIEPLGVQLTIESELPWQGWARIRVSLSAPQPFMLWLRIPSWAGAVTVKLNGRALEYSVRPPQFTGATASGLDPCQAYFFPIEREWQNGDQVELQLEMPLRILHPHPRVNGLKKRAAVCRGPLVYCLESSDSPGIDLFESVVNEDSLLIKEAPDLFSGVMKLTGITQTGQHLSFIPYALWGNRGPSQMNVWIKIK